MRLQYFLCVPPGSMQFLALFSSPCYHKMAVKEMTPSPVLLFLKLAGSRLKKSLGPSASKTYLPAFLSVFLESVSFADSSVANNCNNVQSNAVDLFAIESLRHNHYHLRHQRKNRMVLTELLPLMLLHSRYCGVRPKTKKTKVTSHYTTENEETH